MKNARNLFINLILSVASAGSAAAASAPSMDPTVIAWRSVARRNFVEGEMVQELFRKSLVDPSVPLDQYLQMVATRKN